MKRVIRASAYDNDMIFEDENYIFKKEHGTGVNDTPYYGLAVREKDGSLADKHTVQVRLSSNYPRFEGTPVGITYRGAYVAHGMRGVTDTWDDTEEYIEVLQDALDFAKKVTQWIRDNGYDKANPDVEPIVEDDYDLDEE